MVRRRDKGVSHLSRSCGAAVCALRHGEGRGEILLELTRLAQIPTSLCRPIRLRRASAPMNAPSAPPVSRLSWTTSVPIAVAASCPDRSDQRKIGKATTILAKTQPARESGIGRLIGTSMRSSQPRSEASLPRSGEMKKLAHAVHNSWSLMCTGATRRCAPMSDSKLESQ